MHYGGLAQAACLSVAEEERSMNSFLQVAKLRQNILFYHRNDKKENSNGKEILSFKKFTLHLREN